jgi:hypothetical protein
VVHYGLEKSEKKRSHLASPAAGFISGWIAGGLFLGRTNAIPSAIVGAFVGTGAHIVHESYQKWKKNQQRRLSLERQLELDLPETEKEAIQKELYGARDDLKNKAMHYAHKAMAYLPIKEISKEEADMLRARTREQYILEQIREAKASTPNS